MRCVVSLEKGLGLANNTNMILKAAHVPPPLFSIILDSSLAEATVCVIVDDDSVRRLFHCHRRFRYWDALLIQRKMEN